MTAATAAILAGIFAGYSRAHTRFRPSRKTGASAGKVEGKYITVHAPIDMTAWEAHLRGEAGVGVIPLRDDGETVSWGAIDIDVLNLDHVAFERRIRDSKLPLIVARSKSGGAHCFLFLKEPESAAAVVNRLSDWAEALGLDSSEIFPKQTRRADDTDSGSALNMPYYHGDEGTRRAIRYGEWLSVEEFANLVKVLATTLDAAPLFPETNTATSFVDGPPCLQQIERSGGFVAGCRNNGIFNASIFLIKAGRYNPEDDTEIQSINEAICSPPLNEQEVATAYQSASKKQYDFTCKISPLSDYCNRRLCLSRPYGVGTTTGERRTAREDSPRSGGGGDDSGGWPDISEVTLHEAADSGREWWWLTIYGVRMKFRSSELLSQTEFRKKILGTFGAFLPTLTAKRFERYQQEKFFRSVNKIPPDDIESDFSRFDFYLRRFLGQRASAASADGLRVGQSYVEDGVTWFHHEGLVSYLATTCPDLAKSREDLFVHLERAGAVKRDFTFGGVVLKVWGVPAGRTREPPPAPKFSQQETGF